MSVLDTHMVFQATRKQAWDRHRDRNLDYLVSKIDMTRNRNQVVHLGAILYDPQSRKWKLDTDLSRNMRLLRWYSRDQIFQARFPYRDAKALVVQFTARTGMRLDPYESQQKWKEFRKNMNRIEDLARYLRIREIHKAY